MPNIFDYVKWRGDLDFKNVEFNEIDNLILSRIAYFPFDNYLKEGEKLTLREVYKLTETSNNKDNYLQKEDIDFLPLLANSKRFGKIKLSDYVNKIDEKEEKQFSAITITLPNGYVYVAFRGTDNTIVGWKEDFNMSFQDLVPSQVDAVAYLENVGKKYRKKLIVGGHSKGGNLAVYSAMCCNEKIRERIIGVYNNDGPGFQENIINSKEYKEIIVKVHTFMPQSSIIGRLLNNKGKCKILKSTQTGIMQHDLYTWQVLGVKFIEDKFTSSSNFVDNTITQWLKEVDAEQRGKFIDTLFEILSKTNAKTIPEMGENWFISAKTILTTYKNIDEQNKQIILKTLTALFNIAKGNINVRKVTKLRKKYIGKKGKN